MFSNKIIKLSLFAFALLSMTMFTSCEDETVKGCTSETSDNYDSNATEDDGSCLSWSEKFVGEYDVTLGCAHPVLGAALNTPFTMTVTSTGPTTVSMILVTGALGSVPLSGVVSENNITFNEFQVDEFSNEAGLVMNNLVINGSAVYGDDTNLTGSIQVNVDFINVTQAGAMDNCSMSAIRK